MIGFVVCGPEHSGTTLVSDLCRQVPGIDAGFEVGVLLADTPRDFPQLEVHAEITRWGWGIDPPALGDCCDTDDFMTFYARLQAASTVLKPGTHTIFDKTPRYLAHLYACMGKLPVPFLVVFKDPRALVLSDWRKAGSPDFAGWFETYAPAKTAYLHAHYTQFRAVQHRRDPRVCLLRLEDICLDTRATCERMYAHIGARFDPAYMVLHGTRYENTRHGAVSAGIPFAYRSALAPGEIRTIEQAFAAFDGWFYA